MTTATIRRRSQTNARHTRSQGKSLGQSAVAGQEDADFLLPEPENDSAPELKPTRFANTRQFSTEQRQERRKAAKEVTPMVPLTPMHLPRRRFTLLQQWEGIITEIEGDSIWADILDLTSRHQPPEFVELPLEEFPEPDRPLIREGAVFYWSIGYEHSAGGQIRRISEIRVRRTPQWTARSLERVKAKAKAFFNRMGPHDAGKAAVAE